MRRFFVSLGLTGLLFPLLPAAQAHSLGESYLFLEVHADRISGRIEARLEDLDAVLDLDRDGDGKVSSTEFEAGADAARDYIAARLGLQGDGSDYGTEWREIEIIVADLGRFAQFFFETGPYSSSPETLGIDYAVLFDELPDHRGLLIVEYNQRTDVRNTDETVSLIFRDDRTHQELDLTAKPSWTRFLVFVREGIWHIWIGIDHILFLIALILPGVLQRENGRWKPVDNLKPALLHVVKIVTLFTIAHSITLSLAALDLVNLNIRLVESVIAASVVLAAVHGALGGRHVSWIVFVFGLFHGFGFANVLGHLAVDRSALVPVLLGFNVGVEIGQLAILLVAFPILYALRRWALYPRLVLQLGSALIATLALVWLLERAFDVTLIGI